MLRVLRVASFPGYVGVFEVVGAGFVVNMNHLVPRLCWSG